MEKLNFLFHRIQYSVTCCLIWIQLFALIGVGQASVIIKGLNPVIAVSDKELESVIDLSLRTMLNKKVYLYISEKLNAASLTKGNKGDKKTLISQTKLIYMLANLGQDREKIEQILLDISRVEPEENVDVKSGKLILADLDQVLQKIIDNKEVLNKITSLASYEQPLLIYDIENKEGKKRIKRVGYERMDIFFNHPRYADPDKKNSEIISKDDHKKVMVDLVNEAKPGDSIYFNFYDFDLTELASALVEAKNRNVYIMGGVDTEVYAHKPAVKELVDGLASKEVVVEKVDSVGLNHQKILVLKSKTGKSKTLLSSGNATYSCSSPDGDLWNLPKELRPEQAIPNPNNMILVEGNIPAVIALSEIKKNIQYKLRGQSEFPIGGAYQLLGPWDPETQTRDSMLMAFSPNGGLGNIGKDIYSRIFKGGTNRIDGAFFSFSAKNNLDDLFESVFRIIEQRREKGEPATDILRFVGDSQFALRDFSNLLTLSGYKLVEFDPNDPFTVVTSPQNIDPEDPFAKPISLGVNAKKVYIKDFSDPRLKKLRRLLTSQEWDNWQENIRVSPAWFLGDEVDYQGNKYPWQVKLHHKLIALAAQYISNPGSSINFSEAGEANQEQIIIVFSRKITKAVRGAIKYLWEEMSGPEYSVKKEVERRNSKHSLDLINLAYKVEKHRQQIAAKNQCLKSFSKASGI